MQNRQQILDLTRQMLKEKRYDEARKLLRVLPADDETAQQWLAQIQERERAEAAGKAALSGNVNAPKPLFRGRSLGELLRRASQRKPDENNSHALAKPLERQPPKVKPPHPESGPSAEPVEEGSLFLAPEAREGETKTHPDELPVGAILTRSLIMGGVVIGIVLLVLLLLGG